jgi:hypothetical protein
MTNRFTQQELGAESAGEDVQEVADTLTAARPLPTPGFRSHLHSRLVELEARGAARRPAFLWRRIAALAGSGSLLMLLAALGVAGAGPLAY